MGKIVDEAGGDQVAFLNACSNAATGRSTGATASDGLGLSPFFESSQTRAGSLWRFHTFCQRRAGLNETVRDCLKMAPGTCKSLYSGQGNTRALTPVRYPRLGFPRRGMPVYMRRMAP
jgi:hypothetical protein